MKRSNNRAKLLFVFGTRPEAIKLAPVIREVGRTSAGLSAVVCSTGQHQEMLASALDLFRLSADYDLEVMRKGQSLEQLTGRILHGVESVLRRETPDMIVVQGDTTTTFASALAGFYRNIPVTHVEAGLRTWDLTRPFPEEMNRLLTTRLATLHCAPTRRAARNLLYEGVPGASIVVTGNTVIDALYYVRRELKKSGRTYESMFRGIDLSRRMILVTGHRRESFGKGFRDICTAIRTIARQHPGVNIIYPVHLNPNVQAPVRRLLSGLPNVFLLKPLAYEPFVWLMERTTLILTDSGGIQEEAPSLGKPVLVMRDATERPEGIEAGTVKLVGTQPKSIERETSRLLHSRRTYLRMSSASNPYGDGRAAARVVKAIRLFLANR
jgi:UDP-N-acetylglucosamine 2-epimerase (non-hydrolysing)